eukprot:g38711.t1
MCMLCCVTHDNTSQNFHFREPRGIIDSRGSLLECHRSGRKITAETTTPWSYQSYLEWHLAKMAPDASLHLGIGEASLQIVTIKDGSARTTKSSARLWGFPSGSILDKKVVLMVPFFSSKVEGKGKAEPVGAITSFESYDNDFHPHELLSSARLWGFPSGSILDAKGWCSWYLFFFEGRRQRQGEPGPAERAKLVGAITNFELRQGRGFNQQRVGFNSELASTASWLQQRVGFNRELASTASWVQQRVGFNNRELAFIRK